MNEALNNIAHDVQLVIDQLNKVEVKGEDNLNPLLTSIRHLKAIKEYAQKSNVETVVVTEEPEATDNADNNAE